MSGPVEPCHVCGRPKPTTEQGDDMNGHMAACARPVHCSYREDLCWPWSCERLAVDWRARALAAEAERDALLAMPGQIGRFIKATADACAERDKARSDLALVKEQWDYAVAARAPLVAEIDSLRGALAEREAVQAERDAARAEVERLRAALDEAERDYKFAERMREAGDS